MKNILLIMPYGSVGGMERLALTFYNYYKGQGHTVKALKIIKLESDIINFGNDEIFLSRVDFFEMAAIKRSIFYLNAPFEIRKAIKKYNITHSISFGDMANVFSSLTFTKEFKVASIHALKSVEFANPAMLNKVFKFAFRSSYTAFDKVVCISRAIKKDLVEKCGFAFPEKLQVIYNPHDIVEINKKVLEPISNTEAAIFAGDVVLFLGRLSIQKAPWHLVKAFSLLLQEKPDTTLVFIGDGDGNVEIAIKNLIAGLNLSGHVIFLGRKSNPYQYLSKAKVLALSSYYEGTPNVIVESIALGIPVVSSNCTDGILELMSLQKQQEKDSMIITESGIITPGFFKGKLEIPTDGQMIDEEIIFAKALKHVLENEDIKVQLAVSKNQLLEKFDLGKVAKAYLETDK